MPQIYNMFPRLLGWIRNRQLILEHTQSNIRDVKELIKQLSGTLNPNSCRGLVDCFMVRKQKEEVGLHVPKIIHVFYEKKNLIVAHEKC